MPLLAVLRRKHDQGNLILFKPRKIFWKNCVAETEKKFWRRYTKMAVPRKNNGNANRALVPWEPTEDEYVMIRQLAELGWPSVKVAEALSLTPNQFAGGILRHPRIKTEYDEGVVTCKALTERGLSWRPTPSDVDRIRELASEGLRPAEIASEMGIGRTGLLRRISDCVQVREAFE
jgi:hypothetical protein